MKVLFHYLLVGFLALLMLPLSASSSAAEGKAIANSLVELGHLHGARGSRLSTLLPQGLKGGEIAIHDELGEDLKFRASICTFLRSMKFDGDYTELKDRKKLVLPKIQKPKTRLPRTLGREKKLRKLFRGMRAGQRLVLENDGRLVVSRHKTEKGSLIGKYPSEVFSYPRALIHPAFCSMPLKVNATKRELSVTASDISLYDSFTLRAGDGPGHYISLYLQPENDQIPGDQARSAISDPSIRMSSARKQYAPKACVSNRECPACCRDGFCGRCNANQCERTKDCYQPRGKKVCCESEQCVPCSEDTQTPTPTRTPTNTPTERATSIPTMTPTNTSWVTATRTPTGAPTTSPTFAVTRTPTSTPTYTATVTISRTATNTPTVRPTVAVTRPATATPTLTPIFTPSHIPMDTEMPTAIPSESPTEEASPGPFGIAPRSTEGPSSDLFPVEYDTPYWYDTPNPEEVATETPTPTETPTEAPTELPTDVPTEEPTGAPTELPDPSPTSCDADETRERYREDPIYQCCGLDYQCKPNGQGSVSKATAYHPGGGGIEGGANAADSRPVRPIDQWSKGGIVTLAVDNKLNSYIDDSGIRRKLSPKACVKDKNTMDDIRDPNGSPYVFEAHDTGSHFYGDVNNYDDGLGTSAFDIPVSQPHMMSDPNYNQEYFLIVCNMEK